MRFELPFLLGLCALVAAKSNVASYAKQNCIGSPVHQIDAEEADGCKDIDGDHASVKGNPGFGEIISIFPEPGCKGESKRMFGDNEVYHCELGQSFNVTRLIKL